MNEKEKKAIEDLKGIDITYFVNGHECANFYLDEADKVSKEIELILNLIEKQQKELDNIKEIEKSHQEENGKLRVELEQEKEKNNDLETDYILCAMDRKNHYVSKDKLKFILSKLNISDIEPWSTYKIDGQILFDLQELL